MSTDANADAERFAAHRVVILSGLPGSGKTRYAAHLGVMYEGAGAIVHAVSTDDFHVGPDGAYRYQTERASEAHADCFRRFLRLLPLHDMLPAHGLLIVVDNTNTQALEIAPYMLAAKAFGFLADIVRLPCTVEQALQRNTHGVPEATIKRMAANLEFPLPSFWPAVALAANFP